jgi:hypothetical protein
MINRQHFKAIFDAIDGKAGSIHITYKANGEENKDIKETGCFQVLVRDGYTSIHCCEGCSDITKNTTMWTFELGDMFTYKRYKNRIVLKSIRMEEDCECSSEIEVLNISIFWE